MSLAKGSLRPYLGGMRISDVISARGPHSVVTLTAEATVTELLATLAEHRIGAVIVSNDGEHVAGIVSERDIVRALNREGAGILNGPVSAIMTSEVVTCEPQARLGDIAALMTERRFRHMPVVQETKIVSIVSIGDAVKARVSQIEAERDHLMEYIHQ